MSKQNISELTTRDYIEIKGARVHNLKNIDVVIPRKKLTVITGLSGSGKSSLAFDTLFAEGQRRYVESLSSYARQFLGRMNKPDVDYIHGISPAIAIEQKALTRNPRSTVGTTTEIYEYLKLLYARIGKTISPVSGNLVKRDTVTDVVDYILSLTDQSVVLIGAPIQIREGRTVKNQLEILLQQGFSRVMMNGEVAKIDDILSQKSIPIKKTSLFVVVDRLILNHSNEEELISRLSDSVNTAFFEGEGLCFVESTNEEKNKKVSHFSIRFEIDGMTFEEPTTNLFSFNNPYGACKTCGGFGSVIGIDEDLVIPDKSLSVFNGAVACWKGEKMSEWKDEFVMHSSKFDFPIHRPYNELTKEEQTILWKGKENVHGINDFFKYVESQTYKIQYRVMLSRYKGKTFCPECEGTRLRSDANYVKIGEKSISEVVKMSLWNLSVFIKNIKFTPYELKVSQRLITEITSRLQFLIDVGLGYLTLNRLSSTLSGGESQRINLATFLGSSLVGSMYILDEPSIGLHPRDTAQLIGVLKTLRDIGNTVIVVEHDEDIIRSSDYLIDIGPLAGTHGGEVVFAGDSNALLKEEKSLTAQYLNKKLSIKVNADRRKWKEYIEVCGAIENNLKNITVKFPLHTLTVITGVSGSGKTSLVKSVLYPALKKVYGGSNEKSGRCNKIGGDIHSITQVEYIDQNPIGKSTRSNPVTYIKAYDDIRELFSNQQLSKLRGYKPGYFSFNIVGGRCEECEGAGEVTIEMQFMADIQLVCESCKGKRFKDEVLEVSYRGKNISQILDMTIEEAINFFNVKEKNTIENRIVEKIKPLAEVGLGYVRLGQSSSTLSGGEAQRIKLAYFLSKGNTENNTLFIFDEPTTGLHFHDISKLLHSFQALINLGHSIIVIEHNAEIIKTADWIIDLGPEGGDFGGNIVFEGVLEDLVKCENSYTGKYLKKHLLP